MDLFDEQAAFKDKVGDYPSMNISDDLSWNKMGPAILAGIEKRKKRRRLLIWRWGTVLGFLGFALVGWWFSCPTFDSNSSTSTRQTATTFAENCPTLTSKSNKENTTKINDNSKQKQVLIVAKMDTQKYFKAQALPNLNKKKITAAKFQTNGSIPVNILTVSSIQPQKNEKYLTKDTIAIETSLRKPNAILPIEGLPILASLLPYKDKEFILPSTLIKQSPISAKWQLEIAGGINWWQTALVAQNTIDSINTPLTGWQFSARINRRLGKHWTMKLGLQLQHLRYKSAFDHTEGTAIYQPKTVDVIFTNTLTGAQSITYRDSIPGLKTRKFQHFNQHTTLQLPLLVGFTIGKKRWRYSLHTGIGLQFLQHSTGRIALEAGRVIQLPNKHLYPFKIKSSYLLETQLAYQLTTKLSLLGRVSMERYFSNWLAKDAPFQQRPKLRYSSFGLAWSF